MFCGKCGAQNLENATFCKECGAPLNSTSSISTGSDMGELLVSTKTGAAGRKVFTLCFVSFVDSFGHLYYGYSRSLL